MAREFLPHVVALVASLTLFYGGALCAMGHWLGLALAFLGAVLVGVLAFFELRCRNGGL